MGGPKAFAPFGGRPLVARVLDAMRPLTDERVVACGRIVAAAPWLDVVGFDARLVPDPGDGPMAGLRAGAAVAQGEWLLVAPCDTPLVTPALFEALLQEARGRDGCVPVVDGREQPLVACYRREALARAAALVRLPRELPRALDIALLDEALLASVPHGRDAVRDADTPGELARLESVLTHGAR